MEEEAVNGLTELAKNSPYIAGAVIVACFLIYAIVKWGIPSAKKAVLCMNCGVKKDRDFYMKLVSSQNSNMEYLMKKADSTEKALEEQKEVNKEMLTALNEINTNMRLNNQALTNIIDEVRYLRK